jgi:phosphate:Na+ symporter
MIRDLVFNLVGGLGLFLYGMHTMSEALQVIAGDRLRRVISTFTNNRIFGVASGLLATMIVQSSSVTTVMVVSFINAGLMTLMQGASVILGANIGTTVTGWILVFKLHKSALLFLGLGAFTQFFARRESIRFMGQFAMGFGMLFFGLSLMKSGLEPLKELPEFASWMARFGATSFFSLVMSVLVGAVLTILVQSSSVMLGITIALASVGLIDFQGAAALVLGENIGTTITAQLAAINGTTEARRAAMFHSTVNIFGVFVMLFLFTAWTSTVDTITPGDPNMIDAAGDRPFITEHIAVAHTSFNIVLALICLPLLGPLIRVASALVPAGKREQTQLQFLYPTMLESPVMAIQQGRLEVFHMAHVVDESLKITRDLFEDMAEPRDEMRERILKKERVIDAIQHEITIFMSKVMSGVLTSAQTDEVRSMIRLADEIESVADYCERLANYRRRMLREGVTLSEEAQADLRNYLDRTIAFYQEVVDRAKRGETNWMNSIHMKGRDLLATADAMRDSNLRRLAAQTCNPTSGIFFNDMLVALRRIRNHSYNMAEAFQGKK